MLLLCGAGEEDLFGVGGDDAVEGELAGVLAAEFKEEAGTVAGLCVDDVDELHLGGAIEVGCVGDALDGGFDVAERVGLGDDGDVAKGRSRARSMGRARRGAEAREVKRRGPAPPSPLSAAARRRSLLMGRLFRARGWRVSYEPWWRGFPRRVDSERKKPLRNRSWWAG